MDAATFALRELSKPPREEVCFSGLGRLRALRNLGRLFEACRDAIPIKTTIGFLEPWMARSGPTDLSRIRTGRPSSASSVPSTNWEGTCYLARIL
jgi:hypothetical protein